MERGLATALAPSACFTGGNAESYGMRIRVEPLALRLSGWSAEMRRMIVEHRPRLHSQYLGEPHRFAELELPQTRTGGGTPLRQMHHAVSSRSRCVVGSVLRQGRGFRHLARAFARFRIEDFALSDSADSLLPMYRKDTSSFSLIRRSLAATMGAG